MRLTGPIVRKGAAAFSAFGQGDLDWTGEETASLYFLTNHARHCRYRLRCLLRDLFAEAGQRIWLTTPYFVPDFATQRQLAGAATRRVDVRVLVPGKNDVRLVQWAGRAAYSGLIRAGVRIFEYEPRTLHAKTMIVDDSWSTIGTANFDYRSFAINYELNLVSRLPELACKLGIEAAVAADSCIAGFPALADVGVRACVFRYSRSFRCALCWCPEGHEKAGAHGSGAYGGREGGGRSR